MNKLHNSNSNNFCREFKPVWKSFKMTLSFLILGLGLYLLLIFLDIAKDKIYDFLFIPLFILMIIWNLYFVFKLRCPKCGNPIRLCSNGWWEQFWLDGQCPICRTVLKERLVSKENEKKFKVTILLAFIIFCVAIIITAYATKQRSSIEIDRWGRGHNKELSECLSASDIINKDLCYWSVALYQKDISICEKIHRDYYQDFCYRDFALEMKDSSICEKINRSCTKEECYQKAD